MNEKLILKSEYTITFKRLFIKNNFSIKPRINNEQKIKDVEFQRKLISKFHVYGIEAENIVTKHFIQMNKMPFVEIFNLCIHKSSNKTEQFRTMEIIDIFVSKKYRQKGIGKQLMLILEEIARQNSIKYIVGELEEDKKDEPLEMRKKFFKKNDFKVWKDKRANFSGWVIKKSVIFNREL